MRRFRLPAIFCALAVLVCALISRPYANMGICDDGPYILMAQHLANTGRIAYNGWAAPMLGWQLYLGAAFIKLFGFSLTTARMSTLLVAVTMAWLLQRTLVLANVTERNATLSTLALALSPLYLMLSVTYMSDIFGLFAVVICLYGCLRALQASSERSAVAWLCFAVAGNALCGTARQIAWLGILVMVPSTLYLLSSRRRVLIAGSAASLAGAAFILACMRWLSRQPYSVPQPIVVDGGEVFKALWRLSHAFMEMPFLLLPIVVLFLPELRRNVRRSVKVASAASLTYLLYLLATYHWRAHIGHLHLLEPCMGDWVTPLGGFGSSGLAGRPSIFLHVPVRIGLTLASFGGMLGLIVSLLRHRKASCGMEDAPHLPWRQIDVLLGPFAAAYVLVLLLPAANAAIFDRYLLELAVVALPWIVRSYQERIRPAIPFAGYTLVAITAIYGFACTHDMFAFYRARVALAAEVRARGVPDASVEYGWENGLVTALRHPTHLGGELGPQYHPVYAVGYQPDPRGGLAPFAPVHYSRWPYRGPGTLYVVRYLPPAKE